MSRLNVAVCALSLVPGIVGCGGESAQSTSAVSYESVADTTTVAHSEADAEYTALQTAPLSSTVSPSAFERKIVYTAELSLVVEDFDPVTERVLAAAQAHQGFIASSDVSGTRGASRRGRWTIRVPVDHYRGFLEEASKLGELVSRREDSQEVTDEFYDLQARIRARLAEEERMIEHLHEDTKNLEQILLVEQELMRVRTELERLQGRERLLLDRTALSTVTLTVDEIHAYVPEESPTFGTRVARSRDQSIGALLAVGQGLVLLAVALAPWFAVGFVPLAGLWYLWRRRLLAVR